MRRNLSLFLSIFILPSCVTPEKKPTMISKILVCETLAENSENCKINQPLTTGVKSFYVTARVRDFGPNTGIDFKLSYRKNTANGSVEKEIGVGHYTAGKKMITHQFSNEEGFPLGSYGVEAAITDSTESKKEYITIRSATAIKDILICDSVDPVTTQCPATKGSISAGAKELWITVNYNNPAPKESLVIEVDPLWENKESTSPIRTEPITVDLASYTQKLVFKNGVPKGPHAVTILHTLDENELILKSDTFEAN